MPHPVRSYKIKMPRVEQREIIDAWHSLPDIEPVARLEQVAKRTGRTVEVVRRILAVNDEVALWNGKMNLHHLRYLFFWNKFKDIAEVARAMEVDAETAYKRLYLYEIRDLDMAYNSFLKCKTKSVKY